MKTQTISHHPPIHWKPVVFTVMCVLAFGVFTSIGPARIGKLVARAASWVYDQVNKGEGYKFADFGSNHTQLNVHPYTTQTSAANQAIYPIAGVVASNKSRKALIRLEEGLVPVTVVSAPANSAANSDSQKLAELISKGASDTELLAEFSTHPEFSNVMRQAKEYGNTKTSLSSLIRSYQSSVSISAL